MTRRAAVPWQVLACLAGICHHTRVIRYAYRFFWLLGAVIVVIAVPGEWRVVAVVIMAVVYYLSLHLHPDRDCRTCRGTGRHRGWVFLWTRRQCRECAGQGRHRRLGNIILHPNRDVLAERFGNRAKERRNLPRA
jgi:hypothetical protein